MTTMLSTATCKLVGVTRTYHHGNLRTALLEAAERTLADGGELSLRELARKVGVSHGAPRRHFADKQALLDALAEEGFARLGRALDEAVASASSFDARLLAFARTYVGFAVSHAALLDLMFAGKQASPSLHDASERAFAGPRAAIGDAQAAGEVVPGTEEEVATVVFAALQGLAGMVRGGLLDPDVLDATVPAIVERLLLGLRPRA